LRTSNLRLPLSAPTKSATKKSVILLIDKLYTAFTVDTFGEANAAFCESALDSLNCAASTQHGLIGVLDPCNGRSSNSGVFGKLFD
jgi:hypothetical protein